MRNNSSKILVFIILAVLVFAGAVGIITLSNADLGKKDYEKAEENTMEELNRLYSGLKVQTLPVSMGNVTFEETNLYDSLPDVSKYTVQVKNTTPLYVEMFSSPEKATIAEPGKPDFNRWLVDVGNAFNKAGFTVNGEKVSFKLVGMDSGVAADYIKVGKTPPDLYSPSNVGWGGSLMSSGVDITLLEEKLTGNVAGIVLTKEAHAEMVKKYGSINLPNVITAVSNQEITFGYTFPERSSTGANFLLSSLTSLDPSNPFSDSAISAFVGFQRHIPFTSFNTLQMRTAALSGTLDGFVYEYQQFMNTPDLKNNYIFTPFGMRHDSPVYEVGQLSAEKAEIARMFIEFCKTEENQKLASKYGFNGYEDYTDEIKADPLNLSQAINVWKDNKDGNREIVTIFVVDQSGSMAEKQRMATLKPTLLRSSNKIKSSTYVGLVTFSDKVNIALPVGQFDLTQRSHFAGAIENMEPNGGTAMFDALIVAEKMATDVRADMPDAKIMIFVLTDGETMNGHNLKDVKSVLSGTGIPIVTIGFDAQIDVLKEVSAINEAATFNAGVDDIEYELNNLINAEL